MSSVQDKESISQTEAELLVRQSDESVVRFDPQRITDALVLETGLSPELATQISLEVKDQIERSGIRALTAPLIRGLVDARLLEYGLVAEYRKHSRLGVPLFDVDRMIQTGINDTTRLHGPEGTSLALAEAIKREYAILTVFSDAVANAHLSGDLYLEDLGEIDRPTAMIGSIDFIKRLGIRLPGGLVGSRPAKRAEVLASHLVTYTASLQGYFSDALAWDSVNFAFAPMLTGLSQREIKQLAQSLLFELSAPVVARGGQPIRCDLHLDWDAPAYLRELPVVGAGGEKFTTSYGAASETAREFLKAIFEVYLEGDGQGLPFIGSRPVLHLTDSFFENDANQNFLELVCRAASERGGVVLAFDRCNGDEAASVFSSRFGVSGEKLQRAGSGAAATPASPQSWQWRAAIFSSVAINLPRIGYQIDGAEHSESKVLELLSGLLELAAQASLEKRVFLEKLLARGEAGPLAMLAMRPDKEPFLPLSWTSHAVCLVGLAELTQFITGESIENSAAAQEFAASVIEHLHAETVRLSAKHKVRFVLAESHDLIAPNRLARLDARRFGDEPVGQALKRTIASNPTSDEETDAVFYTNSAKLPANSSADPIHQLTIEGALQGKLIWNSTSNIHLGQSLPQAAELAEFVRQAFSQTKVSAITFSPEFTVCTVCRTVSRGLHAECLQCGANRVEGLAQATNRYSFVSKWPQWKLAELKLRNR
ncbi:MAG: anaerobic ribonucleoside-triphosphate reductase [Acidobacteriota bacterium]|nr:anaerobic ribonucleoside-triphosphate reductase [Acidobacteriota bacterium]